jgi:hypothetical protein
MTFVFALLVFWTTKNIIVDIMVSLRTHAEGLTACTSGTRGQAPPRARELAPRAPPPHSRPAAPLVHPLPHSPCLPRARSTCSWSARPRTWT